MAGVQGGSSLAQELCRSERVSPARSAQCSHRSQAQPAHHPQDGNRQIGLVGLPGQEAARHARKLPQLYHSLFRSERFERSTDDKFFISIEARDPKFDAEGTAKFLEGIGSKHVELVED